MYEIVLFNNKTKQRFTKIFWDKKELKKFVNKVNRSKKLTLLAIYNNNEFYD